MPSRPTEAHQNKDNHHQKSLHSTKQTNQHGHSHFISSHHDSVSKSKSKSSKSPLLEIPNESLTHITSFLDPESLFGLSLANKKLFEHVKDDNTWRRAFVYQFLGISPEDDIRRGGAENGEHGRALMLRRKEGTWRREFVLRWNLRRRWERSRNTTVTHIPHHSPVTGMHLMPSPSLSVSTTPALLTASLRYGIVSRSYPLTGKVLRGYLDASGTLNGLGVGNPNAEFSPDLTRCVITAEGGTAKVVWGFRTGAVAVTTAAKAMEGARPVAARWTRCSVTDEHDGAIQDAMWGNGNTFFVTGGADGRVKLWDAKRVVCLWTSELKPGQLLRDPCVKVAVDVVNGVVAGIMKSGECFLWSGFDLPTSEDLQLPINPQEIRIPTPVPAAMPSGPYADADAVKREVTAFCLRCTSSSAASILIVYGNDAYFYRSSINLLSQEVEQFTYGDASAGFISSLVPVFSSKPDETSFIVVGDHLGCVSIYPWDNFTSAASGSFSSLSPILPSHKFEAHSEGAITVITWTSTVLVTGSSRGTIKVWDSLSFTPLRLFASPASRPLAGAEWDPVSQIIVEKDFLVASVDRKVMAWMAGPVGKGKKTAKRVKSGKSSGVAKWHQQIEMYRDIAESRLELEDEQAHMKQSYGREREQNSTLQHLGLSEVEAVEYVLMLSRDEEEARRQRQQNQAATHASITEEEGLLVGDFDDILTPVPSDTEFFTPDPSSSSSSSMNQRTSPNHSPPFNAVGSNPTTHSRPRSVPSSSNHKVQISPRFRPEPVEAGFSVSPLNRSANTSMSGSLSSSYRSANASSASAGASASTIPSTDDTTHFPSMGSTPTTTPPARPSPRSVPPSPESVRSTSAWSTPLQKKTTRSSGGSSSVASSSSSSSSLAPITSRQNQNQGSSSSSFSPQRTSLLSAGLLAGQDTSAHTGTVDEEDLDAREAEDIRLAIELSLAVQ